MLMWLLLLSKKLYNFERLQIPPSKALSLLPIPPSSTSSPSTFCVAASVATSPSSVSVQPLLLYSTLLSLDKRFKKKLETMPTAETMPMAEMMLTAKLRFWTFQKPSTSEAAHFYKTTTHILTSFLSIVFHHFIVKLDWHYPFWMATLWWSLVKPKKQTKFKFHTALWLLPCFDG